MKLNLNQKNTLQILKEEKCVSIGSSKVNNRTMNSLYLKNFIKSVKYANGDFWEIK